MKVYGYIRRGNEPIRFGPEEEGTGKPFERIDYLSNNKANRDRAAEQACIKDAGRSILLFETTGSIEMRKPNFITKKFNSDGELLPDERG